MTRIINVKSENLIPTVRIITTRPRPSHVDLTQTTLTLHVNELTLKQLIEKSLQVLVSASLGASVMRKSGPKLSKRGQKQSRGSLGVFIHK